MKALILFSICSQDEFTKETAAKMIRIELDELAAENAAQPTDSAVAQQHVSERPEELTARRNIILVNCLRQPIIRSRVGASLLNSCSSVRGASFSTSSSAPATRRCLLKS